MEVILDVSYLRNSINSVSIRTICVKLLHEMILTASDWAGWLFIDSLCDSSVVQTATESVVCLFAGSSRQSSDCKKPTTTLQVGGGVTWTL